MQRAALSFLQVIPPLLLLAGCVRALQPWTGRDAGPDQRDGSSPSSDRDLAPTTEGSAPDSSGDQTAPQHEGGTLADACSPTFSPPEKLASINSDHDDWGPFVSADGLTIYFSSFRPGGPGLSDIWLATRSSEDQEFSAPLLAACLLPRR